MTEKMVPEIAENPNPNARIAFMVWTPFHYYVYKNIITHLPEAEFVVSRFIHLNADEANRHLADTVDFLRSKNAHWRVIAEFDDGKIIKDFFHKYEIIASVWHAPPLNSPVLDYWFFQKKTVRISYGVAKDLVTFSPVVAFFALSLVDGPRTDDIHKMLTESHIT